MAEFEESQLTPEEQEVIDLANAERQALRDALIYENQREYFIGTLAECDSFVDKMNTLMGYPNSEVKTERYSIPMKHDAKDDTYFVPIKSVYAPKLKSNASIELMEGEMTALQLSNKIKLSDLEEEKDFKIEVQL